VSAGAPSVGGTSAGGAPSVGGTSAGGAPVMVAGGGGAAGSDSAGAAGVDDAGGEGPVLDYSRARWPMPNSLASGLPHSVSYDLSSLDVMTDNVTGLVWQRGVTAAKMSLADAVVHCSDLLLAGHHDWRLPSRIELISLMAAADDSSLHGGEFPVTGTFLSTSQYVPTPDQVASFPDGAQVWLVDVHDPYMLMTPVSTGTGMAVCVRSNESRHADPSPPSYALMPDAVLDTGTGLLWQRTPPAVWVGFADAQAYCAGLSLAGHDDWRTPSLQELLSLPDPTLLWPTIDPLDFSPGISAQVESGSYWSATQYPLPAGDIVDKIYAPLVRFGDADIMVFAGNFPGLTRCVR
jgi:hypothetical protein